MTPWIRRQWPVTVLLVALLAADLESTRGLAVAGRWWVRPGVALLTATLVAAAAAPLLGLPHSSHYRRMLLLAAGILLVQAIFSGWWLAHHRYGPLEWVWRTLTWWKQIRLSAPTGPCGSSAGRRPS